MTGAQCFAHGVMACRFEVYMPGIARRYARQAAQAAFAEADRIEQLLSRFIPHSDIARLNTLAPGRSLRVSAETVECLKLAARLHRETEGAFDIAFRSAPGSAAPLVFDPHSRAVGVQRAGVLLDLGALGKGYAVDRIVAVLRDWGITAALVHAGQSTAYALGRPPGNESWTVALRDPRQADGAIGTVRLRDAALSGSGQVLHGPHIVDPRTGRPVAGGGAAWAIAPQATWADGWSTAFMVLSPQRVAALCGRRDDISAILLPAAREAERPLCYGRTVSLEWTA